MPLITANGVRLRVETLPHHRARAEALPIIMIHGLAASSAFWHAAGARLLAGQGRVVLYDLRGHGKSDTPDVGYSLSHMAGDLFAVMDALDIPKARLIAHSFGGMIALRAAVRDPDRVAGMVLADTRVRPLQKTLSIASVRLTPGMIARLAALGIVELPEKEIGDGVDYLKTVARIQLAAGAEADALLAELYQHPGLFRSRRTARKWVALAERASFVEELSEGESFSASDLQRIACPMLVLVGERSPMRRSALALKAHCAQARLVQIPGAGHFFPLSKPRAFLRPTLRFLRMVKGARDEAMTP